MQGSKWRYREEGSTFEPPFKEVTWLPTLSPLERETSLTCSWWLPSLSLPFPACPTHSLSLFLFLRTSTFNWHQPVTCCDNWCDLSSQRPFFASNNSTVLYLVIDVHIHAVSYLYSSKQLDIHSVSLYWRMNHTSSWINVQASFIVLTRIPCHQTTRRVHDSFLSNKHTKRLSIIRRWIVILIC